jgi:protein arginine kinase
MSVISQLLSGKSEILHTQAESLPIVLMTRVRLARNLNGLPFPGWADLTQREKIWTQCTQALCSDEVMDTPQTLAIPALNKLERSILVERHLISRELSEAEDSAGVVVNHDQSCAVMINEEDHLRLQVMRAGYNLKKVWRIIDRLDTALEAHLDYAFNRDLGYLTACPTNVGTGIRASAMMHLPALVMSKQMDKVIRAVNQLGIVVRGLFGEGSDATGNIFQISNQQTLGESEWDIMKRLQNVLDTVIEQEQNARIRLLEKEKSKLLDKIGRSFGVLQNGHLLSSQEAMNLLSLIRLAADLGIFPDPVRGVIDRLFIECQPAHIQYFHQGNAESSLRDVQRATVLRAEFRKLPLPDFDNFKFSV